MSEDSSAPKKLTPQQLAHLKTNGHLTPEEVLALESGDPDQGDAAMRGMRARHASDRLEAAVNAGTISEQEAADLIQQVRHGGHSRQLRARINKLARRDRE
jgi:hypothetical protein